MDIIDSYTSFLIDDAKDEKTIQSYRYTAVHFINWIGGKDELVQTSPILIKEYLTYLRHEKRLSPPTVNKYIAGLNSFFRYLADNDYIKVNPMDRVKRVSIANSNAIEFKWLTPLQQQRFLSYAELESNEWLRIRNLAVIDLMLFAGLRVQEVADLLIEDVSIKGGNIKIIIRDGKKGKYAVVTLIQKYARNMKKWLNFRNDCKKEAHIISKRLFVSERSGKLSTRSIQKFITKYASLAGMSDISPHRLRHSFCKNLARQNTPIEIIRRLARHEKIETTAIYIEPAGEELIEALKNM